MLKFIHFSLEALMKYMRAPRGVLTYPIAHALRFHREKYVHGREKKKERIMPSLVATTSALVSTYNVRVHALRIISI